MAEAIGIALSVAPLVVTAAEHYSTAAGLIKRYRLYRTKREELISKVKVQRVIFRKTIWRLLAYDIGLGEDMASQMITDAQHPGWSNDETDAYFTLRLGDVSEEMMDSLRMIQNQLAMLKVDEPTVSQSTSPGPNLDSDGDPQKPNAEERIKNTENSHRNTKPKGDNVHRVSVGKKIRFALSEDKLREAVEKVRILTKDFRTLIEQTAPPQGRTATSRPSSSTRGRVARYAAVKTAATDLYQALGLACTKHTAHQAHLSLKPTYGDLSQIKFTIAFRQTIPLAESRKLGNYTNSPMWLTVESQVNGTIETTGSSKLLNEVRSTMKRPADTETASPVITRPKRLVKKSVKFHLATESRWKCLCRLYLTIRQMQ